MSTRAGRPRALHLARLDLRADRAGSLSLAILLFVTTTLAMAVPIVFTRAADAALPAMMAAAPPVQRDLAFTLEGRLDGPPSDPLAEVRAAGERLEADLPPSVAGLVDHSVTAADTPELAARELAGDGYTAGLRLRAQPNIEDRIRFLEGRPPKATLSEVQGSCPLEAITEIAMSAETLSSLKRGGWILGRPVKVGDQIRLYPERGDSMVARIVGTFEPLEPTSDDWADRALLVPRVVVRGDGDSVEVHGTALVATDQVPCVAKRFGSAFTYAWRFILDWGEGSGAAAEAIAAEVGALRVTYPFRGSTEGSDVPSVSTGLLTILERYIAERSTAQAAMILALIGPAAAAVGALGMIAATIARRRQSAVRVIRARGATDRQVVVTRLILALVIVVPATILPALTMIVLAGPEWAMGIGLIAVVMTVLTVALVIITTRHVLREDAGLLRQARPTAWWGGPRSLVRDGLLLAVAVAGVIWIGQRGATEAAEPSTKGATSAAALAGVDPLLVLVPTIVALTGGLIAWRCYLPIVRVLSAVAAAYRGFVPVHALRGPSRGGGSLQVPLVILVVTLAIGVFSTIVLASLQRQQDLVAWIAVGAEYRIDSATRDNLPLGVADVPGVESAADVILRDGFLAGGSVRAMPVVAEALDAEAYRRVVAGTPADGLLPEAFTSSAWDGSAGTTPETAIPAILVGQAARRPALKVGELFELSGLGKAARFRVAGIVAEFPGAGSPQGTVIVPAGAVRAADPTHAFAPNQIFVRASPALGAAMRAGTVGRFGAPNVALASRADVRAGLESDPLVRDTSTGFLLAFGVALAFAALVVAAAVVGDVAARHGEIALLRALGTRPRQVLGVIVVEQGTVVITAVLGGLALGCLMGLIAVPSLGLDQFVRPGQIVEATIEWPVVSGVAIAQAALALVVMLAATLVARRRDPVPAMMRDA